VPAHGPEGEGEEGGASGERRRFGYFLTTQGTARQKKQNKITDMRDRKQSSSRTANRAVFAILGSALFRNSTSLPRGLARSRADDVVPGYAASPPRESNRRNAKRRMMLERKDGNVSQRTMEGAARHWIPLRI